jgi:hypothetical protein
MTREQMNRRLLIAVIYLLTLISVLNLLSGCAPQLRQDARGDLLRQRFGQRQCGDSGPDFCSRKLLVININFR